MEAIETIEGKHCRGLILPDSDPENPRDWDNLGTMTCWHNRYNLGDQQPRQDPDEWKQENPAYIRLPLFLYDHGVTSISTRSFVGRAQHAEWDSGQVGYIDITAEKIRENYGVRRISKKLRERVTRLLVEEVKEYDSYLTGDCYGFRIEATGGEADGEDLESCWGFIGLDCIRQEVAAAVNSWDEDIQEKIDQLDQRVAIAAGHGEV